MKGFCTNETLIDLELTIAAPILELYQRKKSKAVPLLRAFRISRSQRVWWLPDGLNDPAPWSAAKARQSVRISMSAQEQ